MLDNWKGLVMYLLVVKNLCFFNIGIKWILLYLLISWLFLFILKVVLNIWLFLMLEIDLVMILILYFLVKCLINEKFCFRLLFVFLFKCFKL